MKRISHDLGGVAQRLNRLSDEFGAEVEEVSQVWNDAKGRAYMQQNASEVQPAINQLVTAARVLTDLYEEIAKKLRDPQQS
jgi:uncharacterized protein YukE